MEDNKQNEHLKHEHVSERNKDIFDNSPEPIKLKGTAIKNEQKESVKTSKQHRRIIPVTDGTEYKVENHDVNKKTTQNVNDNVTSELTLFTDLDSEESSCTVIENKEKESNQKENDNNELKNNCPAKITPLVNIVRIFKEIANVLFSPPMDEDSIENYFKDYENEKEIDSQRREQEKQADWVRQKQERERQEILERQEREREKQRHGKERYKEYESTYLDLAQEVSSNIENIGLNLYVEKKQNQGEDSIPLNYRSSKTYCVGVFDGMGGAGASEYTTYTIGNKSGAYLASRFIRALCLEKLQNDDTIGNIIKFKNIISVFLNDLLTFWDIRPTGLRSSVIRILPTTLAIVEAKQKGKKVKVKSYWAGDSRNYILLRSGLQQISVDDLRPAKDPLDNLKNDAALSNCICQDKPFVINEIDCGQYEEPLIILSATDGCYGYLPTPMHFEYILLHSLMHATDCDSWRDNILKILSPISGDDFSIGLQMVNSNFDYWKEALQKRFEELKIIVDKIDEMKNAYEKAVNECNRCKESLDKEITDSWTEYKKCYLKNS